MDDNMARPQADQALVSDEAATRLRPSGFDPSRDDLPKSAFSEQDDGSGLRGFLCLTDYEYELGGNSQGNTVYPTIEALMRNRSCASFCGVVEVRIKAVGVPILADEEWSDWTAQAIEARRAETGTGSVHESAVPQECATTPSQDPSHDL